MSRGAALVTGGASGIGRACAMRMAEQGRTVAVLDQSEEALLELCEQHTNLHAWPCDVTDPAQLAQVISSIRTSLGDIERLVHCAAIMPAGPLAKQPVEDIHTLMAVNYGGTVNTVRAVLSDMQARQQGEIVIFGSIGGYVPVPDCGAYCATKAAVNFFAEILIEENRGSGVHIMLVCPPLVDTPLLQQATRTANPKMVADSITQRRFASPEEIVEAMEKGLQVKTGILYPKAEARILAWLRRFSPALVWKVLHAASKP